MSRPVTGRGLTDEEKVEAFIRKHGVTECPTVGTKELRALCLKREQEEEEKRKSRSWGWRPLR